MSGDNQAPETELKTLAAGLKTATDEVKRFAEQANTEIKNLGKVTEETKVNADKALSEMGGLTTRLTEIEQKMARRAGPGGSDADAPKSLGEQFVSDPETKALLGSTSKRGRVAVAVETKTVLSATGTWGSTASAANSLIAPDRQAMVALPMRRMTIRDLIAPGQTASNSIEYAVQTMFTNNAAVVAENTTKPLSDVAFDLRSAAVRTIAHRVKASRQILDDAPMLRTFIDAQMRYGLEYALEAELLYGDNTGQHLNGIVTQATAYSAPFVVTGETAIDRIRLAVLQAANALLPPDGIVLHQTDLARIEMVKDAQGRYLVGDPTGTLQPRLWGLPVVPTMALTAGTFLTGSFRTGAQLFDRMAVEVLLSTEDEDNFSKNMVTVRAEERLALAVYRPTAFITGSLPA